MRRARGVPATLGVLLAGWVGSAGCTHNYYYGTVPTATNCAPGTVQYGSVCDIPSQLFGGPRVVVSSPGAAPVSHADDGKPQIVFLHLDWSATGWQIVEIGTP